MTCAAFSHDIRVVALRVTRWAPHGVYVTPAPIEATQAQTLPPPPLSSSTVGITIVVVVAAAAVLIIILFIFILAVTLPQLRLAYKQIINKAAGAGIDRAKQSQSGMANRQWQRRRNWKWRKRTMAKV